MKRIYVAGVMSDPDCIEFLMNLNRGIRISTELVLKGYAVYSPFIDFQYFLNLRSTEKIDGKMIKDNSMAWLEVSDAVLVLPDYENSKGTVAEIARAEELGIPVYYNLTEMELEL